MNKDGFEVQYEAFRPTAGQEASHLEFIRLYGRYHPQIYARVLAMVGSKDLADDVFQDVSVALWQSFERFDRQRHFLAWATGVALNHTRMHFRAQAQRRKLMVFDDDILQKITHRMVGGEEIFEMRDEILKDCLNKLSPDDRDLLRDHYQYDETIASISTKLNKSVPVIYRRLSILKRKLFKCVDFALKLEGEG
ncbi:sigma-70 family RNA polymerase sigma factor [Lacunimicrobium album]